MLLHIHNTMTGKKDPLRPLGDTVKIYVCGVTVYDYCHIGHARSAVAFDIANRVIRWLGFDVTFVKNYTDIDDKIINKANAQGVTASEIAEKYIKAHDEDMEQIGILPPEITPKATEYIDEIIRLCETLIEKGHAYQVNGDVYYDVSSFPEYGKLSGRDTKDLKSGARVDVSEIKHDPLDFTLWKAAKPGEPSWESPWGKGRPGWHIECSAMSEAILGESIDIHGGGQDLIFPHHENEIAQSEAACSCTLANIWMHNGFVNIDEEKMSKSLGNFFTIREVLKEVSGEVLRFFLLLTHYRQPLEYSDTKLFEAEHSLDRIYTFKDELKHAVSSKKGSDAGEEIAKMKEKFDNDFKKALADDFNTPMALAALYDFVRSANTLLMNKLTKDGLDALKKVCDLIFKDVGKTLHVARNSSQDWYLANLQIPEEDVARAIEERNIARKERNFEKSDEIRDTLAKKGIELIDTAEGTRFRTKKIRNI